MFIKGPHPTPLLNSLSPCTTNVEMSKQGHKSPTPLPILLYPSGWCPFPWALIRLLDGIHSSTTYYLCNLLSIPFLRCQNAEMTVLLNRTVRITEIMPGVSQQWPQPLKQTWPHHLRWRPFTESPSPTKLRLHLAINEVLHDTLAIYPRNLSWHFSLNAMFQIPKLPTDLK